MSGSFSFSLGAHGSKTALPPTRQVRTLNRGRRAARAVGSGVPYVVPEIGYGAAGPEVPPRHPGPAPRVPPRQPGAAPRVPGRHLGRRRAAPGVPVAGTRSWQPRVPRPAPGVPRPAAGFSPPRKFGQPGCRARHPGAA